MKQRTATLWRAAAIVMLAGVAHTPALRGGFVWDDDAHVTAPALRSWAGLARIWTEVGATQQYYPVLHSAFWVEHRLWGGAAAGYHAANIVWHAAAAVLLGLVLRRLSLPGAWLAAAVFAVHPVHVESVAWISEQKNTLSLLLGLGAVLAYLRFEEKRSGAVYALASALYVLALLTKTVTATIPAALLVILWWRNGRLEWRRDGRPLAPWLLAGIAAGGLTAWVERAIIGAEGADYELTLVQRGLLAGRALWFYAGKLLWPADLTFVYPRWKIDAAALLSWLPLGAALAGLGLGWRGRTTMRGPLAAMLLFAGLLFPALGFVNVYPFRYSFVADHFQYLASAAAIGAVAATIGRARHKAWRAVGWAIVPALGAMTWQQAQLYRDNVTLFRATLARNPDCWMAHNNLGKELMVAKETRPAAIEHFERTLALRPDYPEALNNLGLVLAQSGRAREAIPHLERALRLKPAWFQAENNLGIALAGSGRAEEAVRAFERAARLNPTLPNLHENWGKALLLLGRGAEAAEHFAAAARLREQARGD